MRTSCLTGANGFLGRHILNTLQNAKIENTALIRNQKLAPTFTNHPLTKIKVINYQKPENSIFDVDYFIHNAAITVSLNSKNYYEVNTNLTKQLIKSINQVNTKPKFIYISSYAAHGPSNHKGPISNYGRSKLEAEKIVQESGLDFLIVRPTGIYGPGDSAFLPMFQAAKKGIYILSGSKEQKITLIHAEDMAKSLCDHLDDTGILHFNDGNIYSHDDLVSTLSQLFNRKIKKINLPKSISKISLNLSNKADRLLKRQPTLTPEKAFEVSQDWDLNTLHDSRHAIFKPKYSLESGFQNTLAHYNKMGLI